jgi:isopentenyl-diphosphate delta-isomerase
MSKSAIQKRKKDHLRIALSSSAQIGDPGFGNYHFVHNALPEIDFNKIDTSTTFLGKKVDFPFFISCMTGGAEKGGRLNMNLAKAAQKMRIAMGVGSQRAAIEKQELRKTFEVRKYAPDIPIIANVGLVQLNYGFGLRELKEIIKMVDADALAFHINPIQEVIQPEGDRNFSTLLPKLAKVVDKLDVPVIVKEVGFGLSYDVIGKLYKVGVRIFDTAGWGGTNWAFVEGRRRDGYDELGEMFSSWGIPTAESIITTKSFKDKVKDKKIVILGSGGVRTGIDIAKAIALGADLAGIAAPFAKVALQSSDEVERYIEKLGYELKVAMFGVGCSNIKKLQKYNLE